MKQALLRKLCNHYINHFNRAWSHVNRIKEARSTPKWLFEKCKPFFRTHTVCQAIVLAARNLEDGDDLKFGLKTNAAKFLIDHELAFRISPDHVIFTPWFFRGNFLVVHRCHIKKVLRVVHELLDTFYNTSGLKHQLRPARDINPDIPF